MASEFARLREVILAWPPESLGFREAPDVHLMLERPDLARIRAQAEGIAEFYRQRGIAVHWARPDGTPPPNFLFQRDLFFMTPEGAILARPASPQRAREARHAALALATIGVPILATPRGSMLFEGADALWLDATTVAVGIGFRSNRAGFDLLAAVLADMGVAARPVRMPPGVQHLLGVVNRIDADLAMVQRRRIGDELLGLLQEHGIATIDVPDEAEAREGRAMNFVTLGPRCVVMPAGCPRTRRCLEDAGVDVHTLEVGEYIKAAGALGCLTGIIARQ